MKNETSNTPAVNPSRIVSPLPCPFCGCKPKVEIERDRWTRKFYRVRCQSLRCHTKPRTCTHSIAGIPFYREDAIAAWNTRHDAACCASLIRPYAEICHDATASPIERETALLKEWNATLRENAVLRGAMERLCSSVSRRMMPDEPTPEDRMELREVFDAASSILRNS